MFWKGNNRKRIYLDYAAGTPIKPEVVSAMQKAMNLFGNPGTLHKEGLLAKEAVSNARQKIAESIFCRANQILFTSGATESNNLAVLGTIKKWRKENPGLAPHIVTTKIEHPSVLEIFKYLQKEGAEVTYLEVDSGGLIDIKKLREALKENTVLVSVIWASNEIGVLQPVKEIAKAVRHFKKHTLGNHESVYPLVHTDASQVPLYEEIDLRSLGTDMMTMSAEKIYGPRGAGLLYVKDRGNLEKVTHGGSQEFNLRPGTENVSAIVGFAESVSLAVKNREKENARIKGIQDYCLEKLEKEFSGKYILNGSFEHRLPNNINITFPKFDSELLVIELDAKGVAVSEKSACNTEDEESYVIDALGTDSGDWGSIRISFGINTKKSDIDYLVKSLKEIFIKYDKIIK